MWGRIVALTERLLKGVLDPEFEPQMTHFEGPLKGFLFFERSSDVYESVVRIGSIQVLNLGFVAWNSPKVCSQFQAPAHPHCSSITIDQYGILPP